MKTLRNLTMVAVLCAIAALFVAVLPIGALGYYSEEQGFSAQALLNKPGVTFDPAPLKNYADTDSSVVIKVVEPPDYSSYDDDTTYDEPPSDDKLGGGDVNDTHTIDDDSSSEAQKETPDGSDGGSLEDFMWAPGTYYIYRSHYNTDLGVVVNQVDESYPYFDESGYQEKWMNLSGVQVTIVVPTKWEYKNVTSEWRTLTVDQEFQLNQSLVDLAESLGYLDNYGYTYDVSYYYIEEGKEGGEANGTVPQDPPPEPTPPSSFNVLSFSKDNISVMIFSGPSRTMDGLSEVNQTMIHLSGPGGETGKEPYVSDIKKMLAHIGMNVSQWDDALLQSDTYPMPTLVPAINIDMSKMDWPAAMRAELEWLVKEKVISGLLPTDVDDICNLTNAGPAWMYDRVMYLDGSWTLGSAFWKEVTPALLGGEGDFSSPPTAADLGDPKSGGLENSNTNNVGSEAMPMTIFAPGTATTDNPDNKMSQMTMIIAIVALCATFFIIVLLGVLMFTRLRRNSILDNLNRKNIYEMVKSKPGIHFNELIRTLDMQPGVLSHHLNILESEEYVKSLQDANHRRFYLYGENTERKIMLTDIQLKILGVVSKTPGISQSNISKSIGRNRMIVNYHIKILRDVNMLQLEKSGRESMCYITDVAKLSLAS